uniref:Chitin deacetylase n=1 Tax=Moniliophthora roreri TaxID=221103 RepID=A0A0W0FMW8_MONRR
MDIWSHLILGDMLTSPRLAGINTVNEEMWRVERQYLLTIRIAKAMLIHPSLKALDRIIGVTSAFMRCSYSKFNDLVHQVSAARGQSIIEWDFDSSDTLGHTADQIKADYAALIQRQPNNILMLNHETKDAMYTAIPELKKAEYKFVMVAECLGMQPCQRVGGPQNPNPSWRC